MRKNDLIRKNMVESVRNERNILAMANNPFVVGLSCCIVHEVHGMNWCTSSNTMLAVAQASKAMPCAATVCL